MKRSILYLQYTNPANYPPLEHSGLILVKAGWDVRLFGTQSEGASNKLAFPKVLEGRQSLWKHKRSGLRQKLHYAAYTFIAFWRVLWQRPEWVYCSDLTSCPAAWLIGKLTGTKVLYHEHDSPDTGESLKAETLKTRIGRTNLEIDNPAPGLRPTPSGFQRFLLWTRKGVGRSADLVVLPNKKRLEFFVNNSGRQKPSLCVWNCPRKDEVLPPKNLRQPEDLLTLVFHGSINRDRLPLSILEAMRQFSGRVQLSVVGYETVGSKGYMNAFLQQAERFGVGTKVEYAGALPERRDIYQQAAKCDVGLAFMPLGSGDINMEYMTGASNKPFDYLACGLALLVSARPDWEEMFVRPSYGRACDPSTPDSIAEQLQWFLDHPAEAWQMGERGRQRILEEWNYETQFSKVSHSIAKL